MTQCNITDTVISFTANLIDTRIPKKFSVCIFILGDIDRKFLRNPNLNEINSQHLNNTCTTCRIFDGLIGKELNPFSGHPFQYFYGSKNNRAFFGSNLEYCYVIWYLSSDVQITVLK